MTRKPTSDEQFGSYNEGDELPLDPIANEVGYMPKGYSIVDDPGFADVEEEDHA